MSFKILGHVIHNVSLPATQKLVLIVLADFYNEESGKAWPSQDTLCTVTGLSLRSINRAIRELKRKGHIKVWKERSAGQYPHNAYRINHAPQRHMVEKVGAKNNQTTRQKERKKNDKNFRIAAERRGVSRVTAIPAGTLLVSQARNAKNA
jgi:transcription initiation factor IIE alpha subunit